MNILIASSEAVPFAKTGGLADVCGVLPHELAKLGHNVILMIPAYSAIKHCGVETEELDVSFDIPIGSKIVTGRFLRAKIDSPAQVILVKQDDYFDRPQLYGENGEDYRDNCERFAFFSRAVLESIQLLNHPVDLIHCNDWQTGLIPAYLKLDYHNTRGYESIATLLTIHNMAYQGVFWHWDMLLTGIDWKYFNWRQMEYYGNLNLLKTGIVFADLISTVSPTYAGEIQTADHGCGLEGVLQQRKSDLSGILNGIDGNAWNPATDPYLPANYDVSNWSPGKAANKAALQSEFALAVDPHKPLIGLVGRLAQQKGWELILELMQQWIETESSQWVILGTGQPEYQRALAELSRRDSQKVAVKLAFSNELAHQIEAAADVFLMPSQFEPCGLNQLYSLRYGSVPVVRSTGGLADTIVDATPENLSAETANGFSFDDFDTGSLNRALSRAVDTYRQKPKLWRQIVETGMRQDLSWKRSAERYVQLYERLASEKADMCLR